MSDAGAGGAPAGDAGANKDAGGDGKQAGSMLDVDKIKAAKDGGEGAPADQKVVTTDDPNKKLPAGTTDQPGQKAERPAYLTEDKFWDAEKGEVKTELLVQNLKELQTKFSKGDHKAPEKADGYKLTFSDEQKVQLFGSKDADMSKDPGIKAVTEWGAKNKVSQSAMDELLGQYAELTGAEMGKFQIDVGKERQSLGKNADAIIQNQHAFFEQMFKNGEIGEAELKEASILFETAAGVKLMQAIRARYGEQSIPTDIPAEGADMPSAEELGKMVVDAKYGVDKTFTAKVDNWYKKRYGTAPAMSSVSAR